MVLISLLSCIEPGRYDWTASGTLVRSGFIPCIRGRKLPPWMLSTQEASWDLATRLMAIDRYRAQTAGHGDKWHVSQSLLLSYSTGLIATHALWKSESLECDLLGFTPNFQNLSAAKWPRVEFSHCTNQSNWTSRGPSPFPPHTRAHLLLQSLKQQGKK